MCHCLESVTADSTESHSKKKKPSIAEDVFM